MYESGRLEMNIIQNEETIEFDPSRDALFVMKNDAGELIATISIDEDQEVDSPDCMG